MPSTHDPRLWVVWGLIGFIGFKGLIGLIGFRVYESHSFLNKPSTPRLLGPRDTAFGRDDGLSHGPGQECRPLDEGGLDSRVVRVFISTLFSIMF